MLLAFKRGTQNSVETMVKLMSGPIVHVDMIPMLDYDHDGLIINVVGDQKNNPEDNAAAAKAFCDDLSSRKTLNAYTSYMFERFSRNPFDEPYCGKSYTGLFVPLTPTQIERAHDYLEQCVNRSTPYNYADLVTCILPVPPILIADVQQDGTPPPTLFCSQAAVLCLRHALKPRTDDEDETPVYRAVVGLNSRLTTPYALYKALLPVAYVVHFGIQRASVDTITTTTTDYDDDKKTTYHSSSAKEVYDGLHTPLLPSSPPVAAIKE